MKKRLIKYSAEARKEILKGVEMVDKVVGATMGPSGRNIMFETQWGAPRMTKDGVSVAKEIVSDGFEGMGVKMIQEVAVKTNDDSGDGTSTSVILGYAIAKEGVKMVESGMNPMELKKGIDDAVKDIVSELGKLSQEVVNNEQIKQVATISANGDTSIGNKIAEAFEKVGKDGVITVENGSGFETTLEMQEGMQFDRGYLAPQFVTNEEKMICEYKDAYVLMIDGRLSGLQPLLPILEAVAKSTKPLLVMADTIEGEALAMLVVNKLRSAFKTVAIKNPGFGESKKALLEDIAVMTNGTVISEGLGMKLEDVTIDMLGVVKTLKVTKETTTLIDGAGTKESIDKRVASIRTSIEQADNGYDEDKFKERLAKLIGGVAVINVGGSSEVEVKEVKDRVDDALAATKAAVEEGVITGGGSALLYASNYLGPIDPDASVDYVKGYDIVKTAVEAPIRRIIENGGGKADLIIEKIREANDVNTGYNARTEVIEDLYANGVIDPKKVTRVALENASSIATMLITTEAVIVDDVKDEPAPMPGISQMPGGMM